MQALEFLLKGFSSGSVSRTPQCIIEKRQFLRFELLESGRDRSEGSQPSDSFHQVLNDTIGVFFVLTYSDSLALTNHHFHFIYKSR